MIRPRIVIALDPQRVVAPEAIDRAASPLLVIPRGRERRLENLLEDSSTAALKLAPAERSPS